MARFDPTDFAWTLIRPRVFEELAGKSPDSVQVIDSSIIRAHQRSVAPALHRQRNLVERFFDKLKPFRKIATRHEKPARKHLAAVLIASSRLWRRFRECAS